MMVQSLVFRWNSVVLVTAVHKVLDRHCFASGLFLTWSYGVTPLWSTRLKGLECHLELLAATWLEQGTTGTKVFESPSLNDLQKLGVSLESCNSE